MKIETDQDFIRLLNKENKIIYFAVCKYFHNPEDQEDVAQEVRLRAFQSYRKFNGDSKFSTWLYKLAIHTTISELRKRTGPLNMEDHTLYFDNVEERFSDIQDEVYEENKFWDLFITACEKLSQLEKKIIWGYFRGISHEKIAAQLDVSPNVVRVRKFRIMDRIRISQNTE